jgi:tetrahydromethanopterin S-methyltransferase subunit A
VNLPLKISPAGIDEAVSQLREAAGARKCYHCGCLRSTLKAIDEELPSGSQPPELREVVAEAHSKVLDMKYDCLGCEVCWPANAVNALGIEGDACPAEPVKPQAGWPPLPGAYAVLRYHAPVAVCTLTDDALTTTIASWADPAIAIVGTMFTENLGIERLIENVLANPNIRFVIVCGNDSGQQIGHLAGQSLVALSRNGIDERRKIIGARGKRPRMQNLTNDAIEHFRRTVEVIELVGISDLRLIGNTIMESARRNAGPAPAFTSQRVVPHIRRAVPERMVSDPSGYFVVYPDRAQRRLLLEHYHNNGVLNLVIEGTRLAALYMTAIEHGLLSRLDHACYLGKELARAERSLLNGEPYVQDAAPERPTQKNADAKARGEAHVCGCGASCVDEQS